jgi:FixJ family two-component response regulator
MKLSPPKAISASDNGRSPAAGAHAKDLLGARPAARQSAELITPVASKSNPVVFIVDDNADVRNGLSALLESVGLRCETFGSTEGFLRRKPTEETSCLILDIRLPGIGGLTFQAELVNAGIHIPIIFITGHGDIPMSVRAMKAGAVEFLTKPLRDQDVLDAVRVALERASKQCERDKQLHALRARFQTLTDRERDVMSFVAAGLLNKETAAKLGVSEVTVKVHRHNLMTKLGASSVQQLVRMADALGIDRGHE